MLRIAVTTAVEQLLRSFDALGANEQQQAAVEILRRVPAYDDSAWTDEEMDLLAAEDADTLGWEGMEAYQDGDK